MIVPATLGIVGEQNLMHLFPWKIIQKTLEMKSQGKIRALIKSSYREHKLLFLEIVGIKWSVIHHDMYINSQRAFLKKEFLFLFLHAGRRGMSWNCLSVLTVWLQRILASICSHRQNNMVNVHRGDLSGSLKEYTDSSHNINENTDVTEHLCRCIYSGLLAMPSLLWTWQTWHFF